MADFIFSKMQLKPLDESKVLQMCCDAVATKAPQGPDPEVLETLGGMAEWLESRAGNLTIAGSSPARVTWL